MADNKDFGSGYETDSDLEGEEDAEVTEASVHQSL